MSLRRTGSRVVCRFPFIEVEEHDIDHAGGPPQSVVTLTFPDWVAVAAVDGDGRYVLVEQYRHGIEAPTLEPAGGLVDEGESPLEAAARELLEETGHEAEHIRSLGWVHPNPALSNNRCHMFLATGAQATRPPLQHPHEQVGVRLMSEPELEAAIRGGEITHALAVVCLTRAIAEGSRSRILALIDEISRGQRQKVVALAQRLRPDLTLEDLQSPHDFPELGDPDWHFEDGQLAGIQAVRFAVLAMAGDAARSKEGGHGEEDEAIQGA